MRATASGLFRFASADLPPPDRVPYYCDVLGRVMAKLEIDPIGESFSCEAHFYLLPELLISCISGTAVRVTRTREMAEGSDNLVLVINLEGSVTFSQLGREAVLSGMGAVMISDGVACRMQRTRSRSLLILLPRSALVPMLRNPDAALMSVMPSTMEPLRLLASYIDLLIKDPRLLAAGELRRLAVHHIHDLVILTAGATRDATEVAAGRGLRAARLSAIKADIAQNLAEDISAAALSVRHGVSPRYIRKLFAGEETSLSRFALTQRLTRVYRMLADPRCADRTISDIALAVGFGDISTFNREFRRRYNSTPSDVRAAARNEACMKDPRLQ
jgi:AraC-like DNA-binding protein